MIEEHEEHVEPPRHMRPASAWRLWNFLTLIEFIHLYRLQMCALGCAACAPPP
jgi:hypothetical protein